jgi:ferrochelatase
VHKLKTAVIFINIGSPDSYEVADVRKYLGEFLMDADVITAPFPIRWLLVNGIIKPFRSPQSAEKYKSVWTNEGSPLKVLSDKFCEKIKTALGISDVYFAMRYGSGSVLEVLNKIDKNKIQKIVVVPMYPQYASATTGSSIKEFERAMSIVKKAQTWGPNVQYIEPFFAKEYFFKQAALKLKNALAMQKTETHVLFSYHGLPISQVRKVAVCSADLSCETCSTGVQRNCYRAQCLRTSELIAKEVGLSSNQYSNSFQSRLGPAKWLEPSTEQTLTNLPLKNIKNLLVCCPAFVTDCLETLEEINIHGRQTFLKNGGVDFEYVTCLNDDESWVRAFAEELKFNII